MSIVKRGYESMDILSGVVDSNGLLTLNHRQPDLNEKIEYTAICVENETSANSIFRIGVKHLDRFILRTFFPPVAADTPQTYDDCPIAVTDDKQLEIRVSAGTQNDICKAYLFYRVEVTQQD